MGRIQAAGMDHGETIKIKVAIIMGTTTVLMVPGAIRDRITTHRVTLKEGIPGLGSLALKKENFLAQYASKVARVVKWQMIQMKSGIFEGEQQPSSCSTCISGGSKKSTSE